MEIRGFEHQVGGHFGILKSSSNYVCKPLNNREYAFYSQLSNDLINFTPKFHGKIRVNIQTTEDGVVSMRAEGPIIHNQNSNSSQNIKEPDFGNIDLIPKEEELLTELNAENNEDSKPLQQMTFRLRNKRVEAEQVTNLWAGQCQSKVVQRLVNGNDKFFILLEDVVWRFSRPCVVDLKMGTRQYGLDSTEEKRLNQQEKCKKSTSEKLGVRMVGMQLYDKKNSTFHYVNKYEGRRMNSAALGSMLTVFLVAAGQERTKRLMSELESLNALMKKLEGYRFFSSSLLIAFDGSTMAENSNIVLRMIDFAHSTFNGFLEDKIYAGVDEGYILGIESLLKFVGEILATDFVDEKLLNLNWKQLDEPVELSNRLRKRKHETPNTDSDSIMSLSC